MHLCKTSIVGMMELAGVGASSTQLAYDRAMTPAALKGCGVVVASLTVDQQGGLKCLLKNGFKQVGPAKRNPNTSNMILLLVKFIG
jgi:hypothetical protein